MKICNKCEIKYDDVEKNFPKSKSGKNGYRSNCKKCKNAYTREYNKRPKVKEKIKKLVNKYYEKYKLEHGETYSNKYQRENPEKAAKRQNNWYHKNIILCRKKRNCRYKTNALLKKRKIENQPCEVCGKKAIIHHNDYDNSFDITWLCPFHHVELHKLLKK